MTIIRHSEQKVWKLDRITHRNIVTAETGARQMEVWEQFMPVGGYTPLHYHEVEEVILVLEGKLTATIGEESSEVEANTTLFIPPKVVHGFRNNSRKIARLIAFFPAINPNIYEPDGKLAKRPWQRK
jgi:quercetin dioxygenase-like cupin family protein